MRLAAALVAVGSMFALAGCGGSSFSCSSRGRCQNSPNPTQAEISACSHDIQDSDCGSQFEDLLRCFRAQTVCDAQGNEDLTATLATCQAQQAAVADCCQKHPSSDACKGAQ